MKQSTRRSEMVADQVRMAMGELLLRELHDPRIGFTTVTAVKMSPDLSFARIYVSVYGDAEAKKKTMDGLHAATGFIRRELGHRLKLRLTPEIAFEYDASVEYGAHIEEVIQQIKKSSPAKDGEGETGEERSSSKAPNHE
jgi:ribosome-binding factor A